MPFGVDEATKFIGDAVAPLADLVSDTDVVTFVEGLGWTLPSVPSGFQVVRTTALAFVNSLGDLREAAAANNHQTVKDKTVEMTTNLGLLLGSIEALPDSLRAELPQQFLDDTGIDGAIEKRLLDRLLCGALAVNVPVLKVILVVLGIIDETDQEELPDKHQPEFTLHEIHFSRVTQLFTDQAQLFSDVYGWGTPAINRDRLFDAVAQVSALFLSQPLATFPSPAFIAGMFPGAPVPAEGLGPMLSVPLLRAFGQTPLRLGVIPVPTSTPQESQALALKVLGAADLQIDAPLSSTTSIALKSDIAFDTGVGVLLRPNETPQVVFAVESAPTSAIGGRATVTLQRKPAEVELPVFNFRSIGELTIKSSFVRVGLDASPADVSVEAGLQGGVLTISLGEGDGFLKSVGPSGGLTAKFDLGIGWSKRRGVFITGSAAFELQIPLNVQLGPVNIKSVAIAIGPGAGGIEAKGGVTAAVTLGPVVASIEGVGVASQLRFQSGNLGPMDLDTSFLPPTGVGIAVNSGPVHGGGFISFDRNAGRYAGALELSIYDIAVKAFGLIETKVPGVDFSFVIVISAEFTAIQLGFGFTLNGVGGLVGINRTVDSKALADLVRAGQSEELLFPKNLIQNAPTIIRDLASVFPARQGHYVFGPLAKLGWGTPTLITAELGIILEIPGPVVVLLGEVKCLLPKPDAALVKMNLSIGGTLDFPNKKFSLDAMLHDSIIEGYPISGQMAFRLSWGEQPNFALSIGGFHPAYQPPKDFPKLQPMALDLGQHGAATITVSGFFAVTSNTVQIGGDARLHAGGSGITLDASVGVKALFVFSPFHFTANIDASVKISFHGHGPSVHLSGTLEGPSPWHIKGEVCVSILFWDACLGFNETFGGGDAQPSVPELDPWFGAVATPDTQEIIGLQTALQDPGNWSGVLPAGTANVVSRAQGSEALVDPLGGLSVHQKAVPVETDQPISRFGVAKVTNPIPYVLKGASFGNAVTLKKLGANKDFFAPAQYFQMDDGKKLSSSGFEQKQSGYVFGENDNNVRAGSNAPKTLTYDTFLIAGDGTIAPAPVPSYDTVPNEHVAGLSKRSAVAQLGATQVGTRRFIDRLVTQAFQVNQPTFVLSSTTALTPLAAIDGGITATTRSAALLALDALRSQNPALRLQVQVSAIHELA